MSYVHFRKDSLVNGVQERVLLYASFSGIIALLLFDLFFTTSFELSLSYLIVLSIVCFFTGFIGYLLLSLVEISTQEIADF